MIPVAPLDRIFRLSGFAIPRFDFRDCLSALSRNTVSFCSRCVAATRPFEGGYRKRLLRRERNRSMAGVLG